jgi:ceramide glucosyltransferase
VSAIVIWSAIFAVLSAARQALAWRYGSRADAMPGNLSVPSVTIVQPILSGDPRLAECLALNVAANPQARFLWMVDEDDAEGRRVAGALATRLVETSITIDLGPNPRDGENPKVAKLIRAERQVTSDVLLVLDDDTVLPAGGAAAMAALAMGGDLVTGLPVYVSGTTLAEWLVSGFINGQAVPTYFSMAQVGANRTINGMVYALRTDDLARFGGFSAAGHELTDDYAVARLWATNGRRLVQSRVFADVAITFPDFGSAAHVLRRWFIFANRYLSQNLGPATVLLVVVPALLPLIGLVVALATGWRGVLLWLCVLAVKATVSGLLVQRLTGRRLRPAAVICEVVADVLGPVVYLTALFRPSRLTWRSRRIDTSDGTIRYR